MPATRPLKRRLDVGKFAQICVQRGHSIERRFVPGILPGLAVCQAFCPTRPLNRAAVRARHSAGACSVSGFLPNEATQSSGGLCQAFCRGLQCVRLSAQRGHSIERRFVPGILPGLAVCQTFSSTRPLNRAVVCARHSAWACGVTGSYM
jgi:hypothetical protein